MPDPQAAKSATTPVTEGAGQNVGIEPVAGRQDGSWGSLSLDRPAHSIASLHGCDPKRPCPGDRSLVTVGSVSPQAERDPSGPLGQRDPGQHGAGGGGDAF